MNDARTTYLRRRGNVWYLRLAVPRKLRAIFGKEHIVECLYAKDLDAANDKKHERIAHWRSEFRKAAQGKARADTTPTYIKAAEEFRRALRAAGYQPGKPFDEVAATAKAPNERDEQLSEGDIIASQVADFATEMDERGDTARATAFARHAFRGDKPTLQEAFDKFITSGEHAQRTQAKYRAIFAEFITWHGNTLADPLDITRGVAERYVDWLNDEAISGHGKPLAYRSKVERLRQLSHLWRHMGDRQIVPAGITPFLNHMVTGKRRPGRGSDDKTRPYTDAEILALFDGPAQRGTYSKARILDWYALGFYTGMREDELGSRTLRDVEKIDNGYVVHVRESKTDAGMRSLPIVHSIPVAVLTRNIGDRTDRDALLFPYLAPPPSGMPMSFYMGKRMGDYRRKLGFGRATDFHSTRRNFYTRCLELDVHRDWISMYVGHSLGAMAGHYAGKSNAILRAVAERIRYPDPIEQAMRAALGIA
jgi:integrase